MGVHRHQTLLKERPVSLNSAMKITETEAQKEREDPSKKITSYYNIKQFICVSPKIFEETAKIFFKLDQNYNPTDSRKSKYLTHTTIKLKLKKQPEKKDILQIKDQI